MDVRYTLMLLLLTSTMAFTEPPYIPIAKPNPTNTVTVCANGCDYTTLEAVDQDAQPGWLIQIKAGTYNCMTWDSSGTTGNEIVIEAFGNGNTVFACSGNRFSMSASHVIIDGGPDRQIILDGSNTDEITFYPSPGIDNIFISRIVVRNSQATSVRGGGDNFHMYNSEIFGSGSVGIYGAHGNHHLIMNNIIHDNKGTGIQYNPHNNGWSCDDVIIAGNLIYDNGFSGPVGDRPGISLLSSDNTLHLWPESVCHYPNCF